MTKLEKQIYLLYSKVENNCLSSIVNTNTFFYLKEDDDGFNWMYANDINDLKNHIFLFCLIDNFPIQMNENMVDNILKLKNVSNVAIIEEEQLFASLYDKYILSTTYDEIVESVNDMVEVINVLKPNLKITLYNGAKQAYPKALLLDQKYPKEYGEVTISDVIEDVLDC